MMVLNDRDRQERIEMLESALSMNPDSPTAPRLRALLAEIKGTPGAATQSDPDDGVRIGREAGSPTSNQYGTFTVYAASERQVAFLARLIAEKNTDGVKLPTSLEGISKKSASALIDKLIDRPAKAESAVARTASPKAQAFLVKLANERTLNNLANGETLKNADHVATLDPKEVSQLIDFLLGQAKVQQAPEVELAPGAYRLSGDRIVRVYLGQQSGKMLAAELVNITAEDRDDAWRYLGLASRFVKPTDHRLTVEEAEALAASGADHSWCCVCGRRLDDPNSVSRGIGPICRAKQGSF